MAEELGDADSFIDVAFATVAHLAICRQNPVDLLILTRP